MKRLPIELMQELFGPRYNRREFGPEAHILDVTGREPPSNPILIASVGAAGDNGTVREDITRHYPQAEAHGRALGQYTLKRPDLGIIGVNGGCPGLPYVKATAAKKTNPDLFSLAFCPFLSEDDERLLQDGVLPWILKPYDWLVMTRQSPMKRGDNVGRSDIITVQSLIGEGTLAEVATASHDGRVIVLSPLDENSGMIQYLERLLASSYTDRGATVFTEYSPEKAIGRGIAEHVARIERLRGRKLANLDVYIKEGDGRIFVNARESPRATTSSYPHLSLINQLVVSGTESVQIAEIFRNGSNLDGDLKDVPAREDETPHILRVLPNLEGAVMHAVNRIRMNGINGHAPYNVLSYNSQVPVR